MYYEIFSSNGLLVNNIIIPKETEEKIAEAKSLLNNLTIGKYNFRFNSNVKYQYINNDEIYGEFEITQNSIYLNIYGEKFNILPKNEADKNITSKEGLIYHFNTDVFFTIIYENDKWYAVQIQPLEIHKLARAANLAFFKSEVKMANIINPYTKTPINISKLNNRFAFDKLDINEVNEIKNSSLYENHLNLSEKIENEKFKKIIQNHFS